MVHKAKKTTPALLPASEEHGEHQPHSMVAGGLPEMRYVTEPTSRISLVMRSATCSRKSHGNRAGRAVNPFTLQTAQSAITQPSAAASPLVHVQREFVTTGPACQTLSYRPPLPLSKI